VKLNDVGDSGHFLNVMLPQSQLLWRVYVALNEPYIL
jgi:hypothetical protein